ncbi:MAG TPA: hypothetical protein DEF45_25405 [Rhodopirellula sp.]|nr:MAG: hypothetical protein CBD74_11685 [Saprospirales bacterium TMED214]HBV66354.1 hypothetical protein [Rhodopirellula sp.]
MLLPRAVISLLGQFRQRFLAACRPWAPFALAEFHVGLTQLGNDLIHCVTFLRYSEIPFRAVRLIKILALTVGQFFYWRTPPAALFRQSTDATPRQSCSQNGAG